MTPPDHDLDPLLDAAREHVVSPEEAEAQRRSFAYGNLKVDDDTVTRSQVDQAAESLTLKQCACGEETLNLDGVCRECAIEKAIDHTRCPECREPIWSDLALTLGLVPFGHAEACVSGAIDRRYGEGLVKGWTMAAEMGVKPRVDEG